MNPQENPKLEIINRVTENLVRTFDFKNIYLDKEDTLAGTIAESDFTIRNTYHSTLQASWCLEFTPHKTPIHF